MNKKNTSYIPFYIEALEDNVSYSFPYFESEYKINDGEWITLPIGEKSDVISKGERIYINAKYSYSPSSNIGISIEGGCRIGGCVMSLCIGETAERNNILASSYQFQNLFYNCTTIREVEKNFLHYDSLKEGCYSYMFYGCTSLVEAPELPATQLANYCYNNMFYECTNLNYIKMLATDISATHCLDGWVYGVSPTGTFIKNKDATWDVRGASGIPNGWTVITEGEEGGGDIDFGIEFPLYIEADSCKESIWGGTDCYNNSLGATFYTNFLNFVIYTCKTYGELYDGCYYVDLSILDIHIFVDVNGEWSEIVDFYAKNDFTNIEMSHKLGGIVNNYVIVSNDSIQWGY